MTLHDDAVKVVTGWQPTDSEGIDVRTRTLDLLGHGPGAMWRAHVPGHITASAIIVNADRERVLLCLHGRFHQWCQLGGHCEDTDETLLAAALREATEESGIDGLIFDPEPIGVDIHAVNCSIGSTYHFDVRFACLAPDGVTEQVSAESAALGWFRADALPEPLANATEELVAPALSRFVQTS